jgi:hypothetical protein
MNSRLDTVLTRIGDRYKEDIFIGARHYLEVDIGEVAEGLGFEDLVDRYRQVRAVVPLRSPVPGMKVRIDGRTFVNYSQFDSGVVVPGYVAEDASLPRRPWEANDSMILNFN